MRYAGMGISIVHVGAMDTVHGNSHPTEIKNASLPAVGEGIHLVN